MVSDNVLLVEHPDQMEESVGASNIADYIEETEQDADPSCAEDSINNAVIRDAPEDVESALSNRFPLSQGWSECPQYSLSNGFLPDRSEHRLSSFLQILLRVDSTLVKGRIRQLTCEVDLLTVK